VKNLADAIAYHQLVVASEGRTVATQRQYLYFECVFLRYLEARGIAPTLDALTSPNVRQALLWYQSHSDRRRSRGGEVAGMVFVDIMRLFSRFLEREGILPNDPLHAVRRVKIAQRLRQPFTQTEVIALWGACRSSQMPARDEALFLLLLDTGMRIGEACTITLDHIRLDQRLIVVGAEAKGRRERLVPIGVDARRDGGRTARALRRYLSERPASDRSGQRLFLGRDGYPLEAPGGSQVIERLGKLAGVADAGPHRLRHTFATWYLVTYPGDELGLRRIIGHLSKDVVSSYVHFAQSLIAERAGHASLAEQWLSLDTHAEPAPALYDGPGNVRAFHCTQCARRAAHSH
jgi:site-specific recombinase XerD